MKFRKRPIVIEAFRWTGGIDQTEEPMWIVEALKKGRVWLWRSGTPYVELRIATLEGVMSAQQGDWIIRGINGELYPCKPDIFAKSYEQMPETATA